MLRLHTLWLHTLRQILLHVVHRVHIRVRWGFLENSARRGDNVVDGSYLNQREALHVVEAIILTYQLP